MGGVYKTAFSTENEKNDVSERFRHGFGDHLGQFCGPLGHFCAPRPHFFFVFFQLIFQSVFLSILVPSGVPTGSPRTKSAAGALDLWRPGKTSHAEKSIANPQVKLYVGKIAKTGAVRKGGLLRGKVSQGSPSPLKHCVKG